MDDLHAVSGEREVGGAVSAMADHQSVNHEVTSEMIEAGVSVLLDLDGASDGVGFFDPPDLAKRVFLAMDNLRFPKRAQRLHNSPPSR